MADTTNLVAKPKRSTSKMSSLLSLSSPSPKPSNSSINYRPKIIITKSSPLQLPPSVEDQTTPITTRRQNKPPVMRASIASVSFLVASLILIISSSPTFISSSSAATSINNRVRRSLDSNQANGGNNNVFNGGQHQTMALNYLLFSSSNRQQVDNKIINNNNNEKLAELLKDSNHSHASDTINLQLANSVWNKMRQNAAEFAQQRANEAKPTINKLLDQANISSTCRKSLNDIIDHIANLDQWAVQMYNAFGDFPASGFFEGSLTSMGSYHQCVDLKPNELIGEPQYCTFKFQPIVPKRPKFHNILAPVENLANFTSKDDMFYYMAKKAHYFYYTKLRLATCMPSKCEKSDLELLGKQVAVNTYLQYSGVSCLQKEVGFNPDGAQVFALTVLISLASISILGTLVHILNLRSYFEVNSSSNSTDLSETTKSLFNNKQVVVQQQTLLSASNQHKTPILPPPVIQSSSSSVNSSSHNRRTFLLSNQLLYTIDVLIHFSILNNARKLFDTSTSRHRNSRTSSIVPGMGGGGVGGGSSSVDSASSSSQSDSSSVNGPGQTNDISCVHGLRFWTITWIIFGHTMQYTEWAGFARSYQVEHNIVSFFLQPLLNATFSVDTFFLISGLLTTYVTWSITRGQYKRFNKFAFLISRYLRLTPQVLLVILLFIVFPMMGDGPYWKGLIQKESDNCKRNWWVNALYLQAFIKQDHICNLVTWWLSIEMFYHFVSIIVIIALLNSTRKGVYTAFIIGGGLTAVSCYLHYVNYYPPNMLPTLLQRYEIWDSIVLKYFWTPYPHAPSYFVGLLLGYSLYKRNVTQLSRAQVRFGWVSFAIIYLTILFGTYSWNNNAPYGRFISTFYYNTSQVFWSLATGWVILACALGHGGWLNSFLSSPVFVPLGRATYMTYLSHMIVVMSYPAKMNLLIEPSYVVFVYIFISNLFLSYSLGIVLTLVYESPILHLQKLIVTSMALKFNDDPPPKSSKISETEKVVRVSLYNHQPVSTTDDSHH